MSKPIRVLQVVTHMNRGGLETMLMNYYRHIDRTQVQFDFLVHRQARAAYDDEIESLGGVIYRLPRLVPWSRSYLNALDAFFETHPEYQIVHVHQDCLSSVILKAAQKHGVQVRIAHSHSSSQDRNLKYIIKVIYKRSIPKYATHLFACAELAGKWMFGKASFTVLNNAISTASYSFNEESRSQLREQLKIPKNSFVVGHVGRFSYPKNHTFLIDIFSQIYRRNDNTMLLLVGDGDLRPQIEQKVSDLGLTERVIFTGVRSDVSDLLQAMDAFVFPSNYEGLPVTLVEAQASGLPCFISDKVPYDCVLTDLVTQVPLDAPPKKWAEIVMSAQNRKRRNTYNEIVQAGFDIKANAMWLEAFYLSHLNMEGLL